MDSMLRFLLVILFILLTGVIAQQRTYCSGKKYMYSWTSVKHGFISVYDSGQREMFFFDDNCTRKVDPLYKERLTLSCHVVLNVTVNISISMTVFPNDTGNITCRQGSLSKPLVPNCGLQLLVEDILPLDKTCEFRKDDRKLVCDNGMHVRRNCTLQLLDERKKELAHATCEKLLYSFSERQGGHFKVTVSEEEACFLPFRFYVEPQPSTVVVALGTTLAIFVVIAVVAVASFCIYKKYKKNRAEPRRKGVQTPLLNGGGGSSDRSPADAVSPPATSNSGGVAANSIPSTEVPAASTTQSTEVPAASTTQSTEVPKSEMPTGSSAWTPENDTKSAIPIGRGKVKPSSRDSTVNSRTQGEGESLLHTGPPDALNQSRGTPESDVSSREDQSSYGQSALAADSRAAAAPPQPMSGASPAPECELQEPENPTEATSAAEEATPSARSRRDSSGGCAKMPEVSEDASHQNNLSNTTQADGESEENEDVSGELSLRTK